MSLPGNGIFVVQGEMNMLVTAMRRSTRWGSHSFPNEEYDVLMKTFQDLKNILYQVDDLRLLDPLTYLGPFLEVIRSKETNGPVTSLALSAINKFLSYGLIDPTHPSVPATVEDIADAVTHARFVGTDHSSDGVVLMKILQVLRTLMLSPEGVMLTDESVCEIMLSCFRICFESRLTELLRRNAEQCLRDMTQLIFMRLPQFPPDDSDGTFHSPGLSLKKRDKPAKRKSLTNANSSNSLDAKSTTEATPTVQPETDADDSKKISRKHSQDKNLLNEAEITIEPMDSLKSPVKKHGRHSSMDLVANENSSITQLLEKCVSPDAEGTVQEPKVEEPPASPQEETVDTDGTVQTKPEPVTPQDENKLEEYVNHRGIRFTSNETETNLQPYGLVCVKELFRFLISLCNPVEGSNTSGMVHLGLALVGAALELAAPHAPACPALRALLRDPLARNLLMLLSTERISIFALDLQVSFLLFESMREHLKYQMEAYFKKLIEIISADTSKAPYELKEIQHLALESLIQFFKIPGFCAELYINYDCDVYCMNLFEELTKLLSKNVVSSTSYDIHQLSLEALLTILEAIENGSNIKEKSETEVPAIEDVKETKYGRGGHVTLELGGMDDCSTISDHVTHDISQYVDTTRRYRLGQQAPAPTEEELENIKNIKMWVQQGTELFNQKPERGIEFLQEHGVLKTPLDPVEVAAFLRENPDLDKKMIGEYICKRSSREGEEEGGASVLSAFADSFEYGGLRIEQALRLYLETFRLPGEAPLIFLVMEKFAERWHKTNGEPFANTDAAFRLAYAVIMLNMDQHNHNAKKLNVPMTVDDFVRNLRGCNGNGDFDQDMLQQIYYSIKNEEMVMPAERVGAVREAYLWRVLQRRGASAAYRPAPARSQRMLFHRACPPIVSALCGAFERAPAPAEAPAGSPAPLQACLGGLERAAALVARLGPDQLSLDSLVLSLAKFTGLLTAQHASHVAVGVSLGSNRKGLCALQRLWAVCGRHAHALRAAWHHLLQTLTALFLARLLPQCLVEVEDYESGGKVSLQREWARGPDGLLSSIYSYIALGDTGVRAPTPHEKALIDVARECVAKCNIPSLLITETKFLQIESLQELVKAIITAGTPPDAEALQQDPQLEDVVIFYLELLCQVLIQNRDRVWCVWDGAARHVRGAAAWAARRGAGVRARVLTCLVRSAARLLRAHNAASHALQLLQVLLALPYNIFYQHSYLITCGIYELVKTSAQNLHSRSEWEQVFAVLCAAAAGAWPLQRPEPLLAHSTSSRSEGSEDESDRRPTSASSESELSNSPQTQGWIMVRKEGEGPGPEEGWAWGGVALRAVRRGALRRGVDSAALVVRDVAHLTPHSAPPAVRALALLAQAAARSGNKSSKSSEGRKSRSRSRRGEESSDEEVDTDDQYEMVSLQLLDLMHTLHSRTAQIFKWWRDEAEHEGCEDYDLWEVAWKPLLQGIAQFCTDKRKQVSCAGVAYLQRALLAPALGGAGGAAWEACFHHVLCPLLEALPPDARAARPNTIMCKVFLQHLSALSRRPGFPRVWSRVVLVARALLAPPAHHTTRDAARESLKNMLLVMHELGIFSNGEEYNDLWYMTWNTINEFLPNLKEELFPNVKDNVKPPTNVPSHMQLPLPTSLPTIIPVGSPTQSTTTSITNQVSPQNSPMQSFPSAPTSLPPKSAPHSEFMPISPQNITSPVNVYQSAQSPVLMSQSPPTSIGLVMPTAVSGMVPIRNPLYDQMGLTSSVLLQPLNEMKSTPISVSIQSQIPQIVPQESQPIKTEPTPVAIEPKVLEYNYDENIIVPDNNVEQGELYAEYLTNPYTDSKVSPKEATLYDPEANRQDIPPLLIDKQKSYSANATPMHKSKAHFGSTDNVRQESSIFNFSSYFSGDKVPGAEVFDTLITHDG